MRKGFTLVELLVVIVIIAILAALLLPAITKVLCNCKAGATQHLISQLSQATKMYELDQNVYPPSVTSYDSAALVGPLSSQGPRLVPYFQFHPDMLSPSGSILSLVPANEILRYRNNAVNWPGNLTDATAHNKSSFDVYAKDCSGVSNGLNNFGQ